MEQRSTFAMRHDKMTLLIMSVMKGFCLEVGVDKFELFKKLDSGHLPMEV